MRVPAILLVLLLALLLAGCGGGDDDAAEEPATPPAATETEQPAETEEPAETDAGEDAAEADGREVFISNCGSCHTLSDAGTTATVGPSLDERSLDAARVETQVRNGGEQMPAFEGRLSDAEIEAVSQYVAEQSGG